MKPSKNPLKTRNRAIFASDATSIKQESGQKAGNTAQEDQSQPPAGPEASKACRSLDQWTRWNTTTKGAHDHTHSHHISKICLDFALCCLRKSRENTKAHQRKIHFCHFLLKICPDGLKIDDQRGWRQAGRMPLCYMQKGHKRGTPPPILGWKKLSTPIIFRAIKIEKSSPKRT